MKLTKILQTIKTDTRRAIKEFTDPHAEDDDHESIDDKKPGTDNSMDKLHAAILDNQKKQDILFKQYKNDVIEKDEYITIRKALQARRAKLEASWSKIFSD